MSKADKMFEKLGYIRNDDGDYPTYRKGDITIMFDVDDKDYSVSEYFDSRNRRQSIYIDKTLHKAISYKLKELGWLGDSR